MYNVIHTETAIISLYGINWLFFVTMKEFAKSMAKKKKESLSKIQIKFGL